MTKAKNVDEYIAGSPADLQQRLKQVRKIIGGLLPDAQEAISYAIPVFKINNANLVFFAGFKNHVSVYPVPKGTEAYRKEIIQYQTGKGTLQFSHDKPIPEKLIAKTVKLLVKEQKERIALKKK